MRKKKDEITEEIIYNEFGQEIHILNGPMGEMRLKKVEPVKNLLTGEQWCPECHVQMTHHIVDKYYECPKCKWSITDDEADAGEGWPTKEASYDDDFGWSEFGESFEDDYNDIYD